jgi:hypothetical protein
MFASYDVTLWTRLGCRIQLELKSLLTKEGRVNALIEWSAVVGTLDGLPDWKCTHGSELQLLTLQELHAFCYARFCRSNLNGDAIRFGVMFVIRARIWYVPELICVFDCAIIPANIKHID